MKYRKTKGYRKKLPGHAGKIQAFIEAAMVANIARQAHFDLNVPDTLTLTGKNIPGGEVTLGPDDYSMNWTVINEKGHGSSYGVNDAHAMNELLDRLVND